MSRPTASPSPAALAQAVLEEEAQRRSVQAERSAETVLPDDELPGVAGRTLSVRQVLSAGGVSTILVLALINLTDSIERSALLVLGPDIQRSLHLSDLQLGVIAGLDGVLVLPMTLAVGFAADRFRRTWLLGAMACFDGLSALITGFTRNLWQFGVARIGTGVGQTGLTSVHNSLLSDRYPLQGRSRVFSLHNVALPIGGLVGPVAVGGVARLAGGPEGWRLAFIVMGGVMLLPAIAGLFLREPARGRGEQLAVVGEVVPQDQEPRIPFGAGVARLRKVRTLYFLFLGMAALGFTIVGSILFFNLILEREFHLDSFQRGAVDSFISVGDIIGIPLGGFIGDRIFRRSPPRAIILVGASVAVSGVLGVLALYPSDLRVFLAGNLISEVIGALGFVPVMTFVGAVAPYRLRSLCFSLIGIYVVVGGGLLGGILAGLLSNHLGPRAALTVLVPPASIIGGALMAYGARHVRHDLSLVVNEIREEKAERARMATASSGEIPVLQVRNLDYSYGPVQVLFDVAVEVGRGEVVALLGTNGAGKSTLLRAISGLGIPDRGVVRLEGRTVTYLDAEQRVEMGLIQVAGGRAIFPQMTVRENLLLGARHFIGDRRRVAAAIARTSEIFPALAERMSQVSGTLSGGERQMLAIAKALLHEPRILLIDELSLGLAPVVVQDLLQIIERLKRDGTSMLLVEQSINVALAVADRAIFMEKGQVRFEGAAAELAQREDLLRAVFLGGPGS